MMFKLTMPPVLVAMAVLGSGCVVQVDEVAAPRVPVAAAGGAGAGGAGFAEAVQPVLLQYCSLCHNPGSRTGGVDLTTYDGVLTSGVVVGGDPGASKLIQMLESHAMPPPGNPKPTDEMIATVHAWVEAGAQDD